MKFNTNFETVQRDGYEWDYWTEWHIRWNFRIPWFEYFWYDGPFKTIHFGIFSVTWFWNTNYAERRKVQEGKEKISDIRHTVMHVY
jgi:hypothetical protein